jgi:very-short-patch-repair endonuclease
MLTIAAHLARNGPVARRRDLLIHGFTDRDIRRAMVTGEVFRVRHGWYGARGTAAPVLRAVRVGGVLTGLEALRIRGLYLPRPARIDIAVPRNAAALRRPNLMDERLTDADMIRPVWVLPQRGRLRSRRWLASEADALDVVLRSSPREVAVAACDALVRYRGWSGDQLDRAFERAPRRTRGWRPLVDGRADSWGETVVRLRLADAGVAMQPQATVDGVGVFDGRVSPGVYVEMDGAQHDADWTGDGGSSFERDHLKDLGLALRGARSIRITYQMIERNWSECLAAILRAIDDDRLRSRSPAAVRRQPLHGARPPHRARVRKLRTFVVGARRGGTVATPATECPEFSTGDQPAARSPNVRR